MTFWLRRQPRRCFARRTFPYEAFNALTSCVQNNDVLQNEACTCHVSNVKYVLHEHDACQPDWQPVWPDWELFLSTQFNFDNLAISTFTTAPSPPKWLLMRSPMLMDPCPSQQHALIQHVVLWPQLEARFKPTSTKKSGVDAEAIRCQHILVSRI